MSIALPAGRFAGIVAKVNAFLLIALILVVAFLGLVAYKQGWFVHQSPVHFITGNALGINKGMPVKLHGFTIGSVNDMELAPGGVDVHLAIGSEYLGRIPQDGDGFVYDGWFIEVAEMDRRRIARVRLTAPRRSRVETS